jgi:DNA-binding NtrC family response regulator
MTRQYQVLIVEDEAEQAEMFSEFLQLSGPYVTEWAPSIAHMRQSLAEKKPDILLLDYKLPDGSGLQVLEELQKRDLKIPAIMITGQGDKRLAVQAMQLGAADYLVKGSIDLLQLASLIQKTIHEHNQQQPAERKNGYLPVEVHCDRN